MRNVTAALVPVDDASFCDACAVYVPSASIAAVTCHVDPAAGVRQRLHRAAADGRAAVDPQRHRLQVARAVPRPPPRSGVLSPSTAPAAGAVSVTIGGPLIVKVFALLVPLLPALSV